MEVYPVRKSGEPSGAPHRISAQGKIRPERRAPGWKPTNTVAEVPFHNPSSHAEQAFYPLDLYAKSVQMLSNHETSKNRGRNVNPFPLRHRCRSCSGVCVLLRNYGGPESIIEQPSLYIEQPSLYSQREL